MGRNSNKKVSLIRDQTSGGPRTRATRAMALVVAQKFWKQLFRSGLVFKIV